MLFKSDVEVLIGKRPYEEKKILEIEPEVPEVNEEPSSSLPEELKTPPSI